MKCVLERKHMPLMLIIGLVLVFSGVLMACLVSEDAHTLSRIAGFISGLGSSLTIIAAAIMIWARIVGEKRAKDSDLAASDERGQLIAGKAQNVLAFAAIFSLIAIILAAVIRGDTFYMFLTSGLCIVCAAAKFIAAKIYDKQL